MMPLKAKDIFSWNKLSSKMGDWRAPDFSPLKIQGNKRQRKEKDSKHMHLQTLCYTSAVLNSTAEVLASETLTRDF